MIYLFTLSILLNISLIIIAVRLKMRCKAYEGKIEYHNRYWAKMYDELPTNGRQEMFDESDCYK